MLALCAMAILRRPVQRAYSNAYLAMRRLASRVMIFSASHTPGTTSCSRPE